MARVTVEDCVDKVTNRFELVLLSSHRARGMSAGAEVLVERDNDKNPVVALREIAEEKVIPEDVKEELIGSLQKQVEIDEPEEEFLSPRRRPPLPSADAEAQKEEKDDKEEPKEEMSEMGEDDILAALQALEANAPRERGDGGRSSD